MNSSFAFMKHQWDQVALALAMFKTGLLARYGPTQFYDYFGKLTILQQTSTVKEYQS